MPKNPKLLVINWQDITHPDAGGAEVHFHETFRRLANQGYDVTLLCSAYDGAPREEMMDGIRIVRRGNRSMFNFFVPGAYGELARQAREAGQPFDAVIDDINKIPFYSPLFAREKVLGIAHHFFGVSIYRETNPVAASYVALGEALVAPVYRKVPFAVTSESTRQEFIGRGFPPDDVHVYSNGINHNVCRVLDVPKRQRPTVAYFGRVKKYKSIDVLVRAFARVQKNIPDAELLIIGGGNDRTRLEDLACELGLASSVTFTGYVPEEEKVRLLNQAHVVGNPSMKEGFGLTNIEANACGTPTVSSDVPGLRDSVRDGETGLLVPYGDAPALAHALERVLTNNELRKRLSQGALAWAQTFTWERSASSMKKFLEKYLVM